MKNNGNVILIEKEDMIRIFEKGIVFQDHTNKEKISNVYLQFEDWESFDYFFEKFRHEIIKIRQQNKINMKERANTITYHLSKIQKISNLILANEIKKLKK